MGLQGVTTTILYLLCVQLSTLTAGDQVAGDEMIFIDPGGHSHLLEGYVAHYDFITNIQTIISTRVINSLNYGLKYSTINSGLFLSTIDSFQYSFLQLFYSILYNDTDYLNFLMHYFNSKILSNNTIDVHWFETTTVFPEVDVYTVVDNLSKNKERNLAALPVSVKEALLKLNNRYKYFQKACVKGNVKLVEWLLKLGIDIRKHGPGALKSAWDNSHWSIVKLLVGIKQFPSNTITENFSLRTNTLGENLLHFIAETDNSFMANSLLGSGAQVDVLDKNGKSPLLRAVEANKIPMVNTLLSSGANINRETQTSDSLLHIAAWNGFFETALLLLNHGFPLERKNEYGQTPLDISEQIGITTIIYEIQTKCPDLPRGTIPNEIMQWPFRLKNKKICPLYGRCDNKILSSGSLTLLENQGQLIKMFLRRGANSGISDDMKGMLLQMSVNENLPEAVQFLLNMNINLLYISYPLTSAVLQGNVLIINHLINGGADPTVSNLQGWKPIHVAASKGYEKIVELLLNKGEHVNSRMIGDETPLYIAALEGHLNIVNTLINRGGNINLGEKSGFLPIHAAARNGHEEVVELLLIKGSDPNAKNLQNKTALHEAAQEGFVNVVKILLDNGADVNAMDFEREAPIHLATENGHIKVVLLLLNRGANVDAVNNHQKTALYEAASTNKYDILAMLILRGANVSVATNEGWQPIHAGSKGGHIEVVKLLLNKGANLNAKNKDNKTPLYEAVINGKEDVVKMLLSKGADVNIPNVYGVTPLYIAHKQGLTTIEKLLMDKGAKKHI